MQEDTGFIGYVVELMAPFGDVSARRMFGAYGIFRGDLMFGIVADETLYLKADASNRREFKARGLDPFMYYKKGKPAYLSYYAAPEEALENPADMLVWAEKSFAAAIRSGTKKRAGDQ